MFAAQKYADYENAIRVLEAKLRQEQRKHSAPNESSILAAQAILRPGISRFGSFMGTRKASGSPEEQAQGAVSREKELEEQLIKEQTLRIAAEQKVKEVNAELEDLSATLFEQANEMVATERRQNAALRERVNTLEGQQQPPRPESSLEPSGKLDVDMLARENGKLKMKISSLEQREADRKKRLERLEAASKRTDRIRSMLQPP